MDSISGHPRVVRGRPDVEADDRDSASASSDPRYLASAAALLGTVNGQLYLPFWALSARNLPAYGVGPERVGYHPLVQFSLAARIENALATVFIYVGKTFWPTGLSIVYGWALRTSPWLSGARGASIAAISTLFLQMCGRRPWLLVGWLWYLITLIPVIGLVQVGLAARADRYMYVPMVAF